MDRELSDEEFVGYLRRARILKAMAISKNIEGFRDAKGFRHLVRRWCPSLHTFFFSVGELTITLEDVVNNFLLPVFWDEDPFDICLFEEDLEVENKLFSHFGGVTASPGGKPARMGRWVMTLLREKDKEVRRAGFQAFWLSKFLFSEFPGYGIKSTLFPLACRSLTISSVMKVRSSSSSSSSSSSLSSSSSESLISSSIPLRAKFLLFPPFPIKPNPIS